MGSIRFSKPITRDVFFRVLESVGLPTDMPAFLRRAINFHNDTGLAMFRPALDVYRNKVGAALRKVGVDPVARTTFMDTLHRRIYNDPKLFGRVFAYTDSQELFAVLLLAAGPPPKQPTAEWPRKEFLDAHGQLVKEHLRSLRAPLCALSAEQFEACVEFKAVQFAEWCNRGGKFGDGDGDAEDAVEG